MDRPLNPTQQFAEDLKDVFSLSDKTSPEDQLKAPVCQLLRCLGVSMSSGIDTKTEAHIASAKVRPDIAVYVDKLICGYVELKAPGLGADPSKLKGRHNKEQWQKLKNLPNLIYTDGRAWALYRQGERISQIISFADDPVELGQAAVDEKGTERLHTLIRDFLLWQPTVPHKPADLAAFIAPLARFLRSEVENALNESDSNVGMLAREWRQFFFPDADEAQFADAYAQTVTYALLLARLNGATGLDPIEAAKTLDANNGLLARALELLGQAGAREELRVGFELLQRSMEALDTAKILKAKPDLWLYFYEDFLAAYDPNLRRNYGVYYTPREVVELQVRLASELLETRFGKKLGFADDGVVFLDPAVGTGTYLVATIKQALDKVRARSGEGAVPARAAQMAENMYGFEILVGPYAVAHLRLTQSLEGAGASLNNRLKVYLSDTLESPNAAPLGGMTLTYKTLTQEHEAARRIKQGGDILVCLGNPPYGRQTIDEGDTTTLRKGGWVRFGDKGQGRVTRQGDTVAQNVRERPIFSDFTEPANASGAGVHLKNLYNDYVYFWRWALWRLFEQQAGGGIITFITASSYLAGPGFVGMREAMRRTFDELWIIDLGGDNLGTRKTPNVFAIQTPVAVAIGMRGSKPDADTPAVIRYVKITGGTRGEKLKRLEATTSLDDLSWQVCPTAWHDPMLPEGKGDYFEWPALDQVFPLALSGVQFKRSWPIGETTELLKSRWIHLVSSKPPEKKKLFRETGGWTIAKRISENLPGKGEPSIEQSTKNSKIPNVVDYCFRSFDRQKALYDYRLGDRLRPSLFHIMHNRQLFFTTLLSNALASGPAVVMASHLPDLHHFRGSFGGKDVIPLYRDAAGDEPNVTNGLLADLVTAYGFEVDAEDLAAYVYALLGGQSYTARFWNELETPGPRVPLTKDGDLFRSAAALGRRLIWLHTYTERFQSNDRGGEVPAGSAKCIDAVPNDPAKYPETFTYSLIGQEVRIGEGRFGPIAPEIWSFEVSGLKVVQSWLGYRMKVRAGKRSSPLDDIRPERWTPRMTDEFLELIWVLEATLTMEPDLSAVLNAVVVGPCFKASELPTPSDKEHVLPKNNSECTEQTDFFN